MKKKVLAPVLAAVVLLAAVVCVVLFPRRVDVTLQGARLNVEALEDTPEQTVTVQVRGWYFDFLVLDRYLDNVNDILKAAITITPCSLEGEEFLTFQYKRSVSDDPALGIKRSFQQRYSTSQNKDIYIQLHFTKNFGKLAYSDELAAADNDIYVASSEENADLAEVAREMDMTQLGIFNGWD